MIHSAPTTLLDQASTEPKAKPATLYLHGLVFSEDPGIISRTPGGASDHI